MGINGLTTFLNKTYLEEVLIDFKLQNTFILIDGYSLLYKLHYFNNIQSFYGGNYDELFNKLDDLISVFKKCKIEPIFLLGTIFLFVILFSKFKQIYLIRWWS